MELLKPQLAAALLVCGIANASPQVDDGQVLLREGDPLANGANVEIFYEVAMSESGDWCALVVTDQGGFEEDGVVVLNGDIILEEGQSLPSGDVVGQVFGLDLSTDGSLAWTHRLNPGTLTTAEALYVDGVERFRTSNTTPLSGQGVPPNTTLRGLRRLRYDAPFVLVEAEVSLNSQATVEAVLLLDLSGAGAPTVQILAREGVTPAPLMGPIQGFSDPFDVASDGTFVVPVIFDDGTANRDAVLTDRGWAAVHGAPISGIDATWDHGSTVSTACAAGGRYVISSQCENSSGGLEGIVLGPSGLLARESTPFAPLPGENAGFFSSTAVGMSASGEPVYVVPVGTFDDVLVSGGELLLRESTSTVSGAGLGSSLSTGFSRRIAVGSGGREFLLAVIDASAGAVLVLVEAEVGTVYGGCMASPNSTGVVGGTRGLGTGIASANDLVIESFDLPSQQFTLLLASGRPGFTPGAGGSAGNLCLGGPIGRFNGAVAPADAGGVVATPVNLAAIPQGSAAVGVASGETWYFQRWHRDLVGGVATSNFTTALEITFR